MTIETVTVTPDVPFGDCFYLIDEWTVQDTPTGCKVQIKFGINIHKSNWKFSAIKGIFVSRATNDNQARFQAYLDEMKKWLSTHQTEVDVVKRVVQQNERKRLQSSPTKVINPPTSPSATPNIVFTEESPVVPQPKPSNDPEFGPLQPYVNRLPPEMRTMPIVAAIGAGIIIVLITLMWMMFAGSDDTSHSLPVPVPSHHGGIAQAHPHAHTYSHSHVNPSHSSPVVVESSSSGWTTFLIILLSATIGGLSIKVKNLEEQLKRAKRERKTINTAN